MESDGALQAGVGDGDFQPFWDGVGSFPTLGAGWGGFPVRSGGFSIVRRRKWVLSTGGVLPVGRCSRRGEGEWEKKKMVELDDLEGTDQFV